MENIPYKKNLVFFRLVQIFVVKLYFVTIINCIILDDFIRAKQKLKIAMDLSENDDLYNSGNDETLAKKKKEGRSLQKGFY